MPNESFKVFARLRPSADGFAEGGALRVVKRFGQSCIVQARNLEFVLDWVWDVAEAQEDIYSQGIRERIAHVLDGFNATDGEPPMARMFDSDRWMCVHASTCTITTPGSPFGPFVASVNCGSSASVHRSETMS